MYTVEIWTINGEYAFTKRAAKGSPTLAELRQQMDAAKTARPDLCSFYAIFEGAIPTDFKFQPENRRMGAIFDSRFDN